jgi:hypothetical protein
MSLVQLPGLAGYFDADGLKPSRLLGATAKKLLTPSRNRLYAFSVREMRDLAGKDREACQGCTTFRAMPGVCLS